jgi:hypothetical protein
MAIETTKHYGGAIELNFEHVKHSYKVHGVAPDGTVYKNEKFLGVTTPLGVINKPGLKYWSINQVVGYIDDNLSIGKVVDEIQKIELLNGAKKAPWASLDKAAGIGTVFHQWIEDYINGKKPAKPTHAILKKGVQNFLKWVDEMEVEFIDAETKVLSLKYKYAGTFDFRATMKSDVKGKRCLTLGDIKTSSGIWDENWLQTSAYKRARLEEFPEEIIDNTTIVRCGKDGSFEAKTANNFKENYNAFLAALYLYNHMTAMKKFEYVNH